MRSATVVLLVASLALVGCKKKQRDDAGEAPADDVSDRVSPRTTALIQDLHAGGDRAIRATEHLEKLSTRQALTERDGEAIVKALPSIPAPTEGNDPQAFVVHALGRYLRFIWLPRLEDVAGDLRPAGRSALMEMLVGVDDERAIESAIRLIDRYADPTPISVFAQLRQALHQPDAVFPAILELLDDHEDAELRYQILFTALIYAENDKLPERVLEPYTSQLLAAYDTSIAFLKPRQQRSGIAWRFEEEYQQVRFDAGLLLDLFGEMPHPYVNQRLFDAQRLRDPRLAAIAIESLLDLGEAPDPAAIAFVCGEPESFATLWEVLETHRRLHLVPERHRNQTAIAASMVAEVVWAEGGLPQVPDEIELLDRVTVDAEGEDGLIDVYVFRFRTADTEWLAGWSGAFRRKDGLTTSDDGGAGSEFEAVADRKASEIYTPAELLVNWRDYRANEPAD